MALFNGEFKSKQLNTRTSISVILPADDINFLDNTDTTSKPPYKTLYLLHGMFGNNTTFLYNTQIRSFAQKNNLAIVLPDCHNSFYINNPDSFEYYSNYVGEELVNFTRSIFPLSDKREDTYIAGFSMGGYGAIRLGLIYNETFSAIGGISSALITDRLNKPLDDCKHVLDSEKYIESCFGDLNNIIGSDKDPEYLIEELIKNNEKIPNIFMAVGKDDFLRSENEKFYKFLKNNNVEVTYNENEGSHTWDFCNEHIEQFIKWLK